MFHTSCYFYDVTFSKIYSRDVACVKYETMFIVKYGNPIVSCLKSLLLLEGNGEE